MKKLILSLVLCCTSVLAVAQTEVSYELQSHLTGLNQGLRIDRAVSENLTVFVRGGLNYTNRWDWGEKDEEIGRGSGFGIGYELNSNRIQSLSLTVRTDFWFMDIDWRYNYTREEIDFICRNIPPGLCDPFLFRTGTTTTRALQPSVGISYELPIIGSLFVKPSINLGYEVNLYSRGERVYEGALLFGGIQVGYEF
jgi:hypothetical protein